MTVSSPGNAGGDTGALSDDNIFTVAESSTEATYDIDLGGVYDISKVHYTPEQRVRAGHATRWTVQASPDGATWTDVGAGDIESGSFNPTILELDAAVRARYVRVSLTNGQDGATALQVAELRVAGTAAGDPTPGPGDPTPGPSSAPAPTDPAQPGAPTATSRGSDAAEGTGAASATTAASAQGLHSLARTGASIGIGVAALILLVAGGLLLLRRRGAGSDEDEHGEE